MTLKYFIVISLAVHLIAFLAIVALTREEKPVAPVAYFVKVVEEPRGVPPKPPPAESQPPETPKAREKAGRKPVTVHEKKTAPGEIPGESVPPDAATGGPTPRAPEAPEPLPPGEGIGRFLDQDVIQQFARKEPEEKKDSKGITFDTEEFKYRSYMERLKEKIEGIWVYPREAAEKGVYGDLVIRFVIRKDGSLGSVELLRTSGYTLLDEAALKALGDGQPFWPLPEGWKQSSLTVTGHFIYTLYGLRIR